MWLLERHYKLKALGLAFCSITVFLSFASGTLSALSGSEFRAGRIMDDGIFFYGNALSAQHIQDFMDAKVPTCDTNGTQPYTGTTRAAYGTSRGYPPPYTCLKSYRETIPAKPADAYCSGSISSGDKSSAQIIFDVSQACGVSPKALLVLLQKEQSLVTDDWPWSIQYRSATGYGCPDTAACDSTYYGYFNQVYNAARQFQRYVKQSSLFNFRSGQTSSIQYNPNAGCGASNVYLENSTTAALYNYTPYQPNASALNNLYGLGDSCGAYGNRNFWRMFSDWFGTTLTSNYYAAPTSQNAYPSLYPGDQVMVYMSYRNWGVATWYDSTGLPQAPGGTSPVHLATSHNLNRASSFVDSSWASSSRPAMNFSAIYESDGTTLASNQHVAQTGQIVKFSFVLSVPGSLAPGVYREFFQPVVEGTGNGVFNDTWSFFDVTVNPKPAMTWYDQSTYPTIYPTDKSSSYLRFQNSGNTVFYDDSGLGQAPAGTNALHLATKSPLNRSSTFGSDWPTTSRPALNFAAVYNPDGTLTGNQHAVGPGQIVKFSFNLTVPEGQAANVYHEDFQPVIEGTGDGGFSNGVGGYFDITVPTAAVITYTSVPNPAQVVSNVPASINFTIKNSGNTTLASTTKLVTSTSYFQHSSWVSNTVIASSIGASLSPLQTRNLSFMVLPPDFLSPGIPPINLSFQSQSSVTIPLSAKAIDVSIAAASYLSSNVSQSGYPALTYGQTQTVFFAYKNTGNQYWYDSTGLLSATTGSPYAIHLATNDPLNRSSGFNSGWPSSSRPALNFTAVYESDGTTLTSNQHVAQPGQIVKFSFQITPSVNVNPGVYREFFQPIAEGTADGRFPKAWTFIDVTLLSPTYTANQASQSAYPTLTAGQQVQAYFNFRNTGTAPWYDDVSISLAPANAHPVHLGTSHPLNRSCVFNSGWPTNSRAALNFTAVYESDGTTLTSNQHVAQPGQIVKFSFTFKVPNGLASGAYREFFQPVAEGTANGAFNDVWTSIVVTVQ